MIAQMYPDKAAEKHKNTRLAFQATVTSDT